MGKRKISLSLARSVVMITIALCHAVAYATVTVTLPATDLLPSETSTTTYYYIYNVGADAYLTYGSYYGTCGIVKTLTQDNTFQFATTATSSSSTSCDFISAGKSSNFIFDDGTSHIFVDGVNTKNGSKWNFAISSDNKYYTIRNAYYNTEKYLGVSGASNVGTSYSSNDNYSHWILVSLANIGIFNAKVELYKMITMADNVGVSITDAETAYNDASATIESLQTAISTLADNVWSTKTSSASALSAVDVTYLMRSFVNNGDPVATLSKKALVDTPIGWTTAISGGVNVINEGTSSTASGLVEYYAKAASGTFDVSQTVSLKPGYYKFQINGFERITGDNATAFNAGTEDINALLYVTANGSTMQSELKSIYDDTPSTLPSTMLTAKAAFDNSYYKNSLIFHILGTENITLGVKSDAGLASKSWIILGYPSLTYYGTGDADTELGEVTDYTPTAKVGTVSVIRSLTTSKWAAVVLPFDVPSSATSSVFGTGATVANLVSSSTIDNVVTLNFNTVNTAVKANVPFLVKVGTDQTSVTYDAALTTTDAVSSKTTTSATLLGLYSNISNLYTTATSDKDAYFIKDGQWYKASSTSTVALKPFRAYLTTAVTSGAKSMKMMIDGLEDSSTTTEIEVVPSNNVKCADVIFNLNGQRMLMNRNKLKHGVYIVNGKKNIIK